MAAADAGSVHSEEAFVEADLSKDEVVNKYRQAADIVNAAIQAVLKRCVPGADVLETCTLGDKLITLQVSPRWLPVACSGAAIACAAGRPWLAGSSVFNCRRAMAGNRGSSGSVASPRRHAREGDGAPLLINAEAHFGSSAGPCPGMGMGSRAGRPGTEGQGLPGRAARPAPAPPRLPGRVTASSCGGWRCHVC